MLLGMYYHALLLVVVMVMFISTSTSLCGTSKDARFALQKLNERTGSEPTSLYRQPIPGLKRRQTSYVTDFTTEFEDITIQPSSSETTVVLTITSQLSVTPTPPSSSSSSETPTSTSEPSSTITAPPKHGCDTGFSLCSDEYNGGCCMDGYTCAVDSCIPPTTATREQRVCSTGSYLCPASVNYGCCPGGYDCGASQCLATGQMSITSTMTVTTTDATGSKIMSTASTVITDPAIGKATELNLAAKQPTKIITAPVAPSSPAGSGTPISGAVVGGIVAGCVAGISIFVILGWCTYRRIGSRGNNDPPLGVATTNFYDPTASVSRTPGSGSSARYHSVTQEHGYFPKQPLHGIPVSSAIPPPPLGMAEMAENLAPYPQQGHTEWWGDGSHQIAGELPGDGRQDPVYEIEGTMPAKNTRRWSRPFLGR